jgi:hypothetical protein
MDSTTKTTVNFVLTGQVCGSAGTGLSVRLILGAVPVKPDYFFELIWLL